MAEKGFGVKEINLIGASGTPTIESPNNLNLNAVNVAISTNVSIGGTLTVTGNVSVGGTLTYEDVTNIDSVGLITARSGIDCNGDIDVDGHTNLDNVSIAGVTTMTGNLSMGETLTVSGNNPNITFTDTNSNPDYKIYGSNGAFTILDSTNGVNRFAINSTGHISVSNDLDVDGHTYLDNVSIAGVTTFAQAAGAVTVPAGGDIRIANSGGWTGEYGGKIQQYLNFLYIQGGSNGIRFRYTDGNDRWVIGSGGHFDPGAGGTYDIGNTGNRVRQIYSTHANVSGISTLSSINVSGSAGINISYSGADLTMNSAGGIFTGNGGNATNPIVANVSDPNT